MNIPYEQIFKENLLAKTPSRKLRGVVEMDALDASKTVISACQYLDPQFVTEKDPGRMKDLLDARILLLNAWNLLAERLIGSL